MRALTLVLLLAGCPSPSADSGDTEPPPPPPDACDDFADQSICDGEDAVVCDGAGDIAERTSCADQGTLCIGAGQCAACTPSLSAPLGDRALVLEVRDVPAPRHADARRLVLDLADPVPGSIALSVDGEHLALLLADGTPAPASIPTDQLPVELLVEAAGEGPAGAVTATLVPDHGACADDTDRVDVSVVRHWPIVGEKLAEPPYLLRTRSFSTDGTVAVALDGTRLTDRVGAGYDVYVVAPRDDAAWDADGALVNESRFVDTRTLTGVMADDVSAAWTEPLRAGDPLGTPYDVVLDFDRDGTLGPGDVFERDGFTVIGDLGDLGPYGQERAEYSLGAWRGQRVYWPTEIASLDPLPLVVISHGNGHDYRWYDYLGYHLASWGFVVMTHENETGPGIETASTTTLENTDDFLENLDTIAEGALLGHVDAHRIGWIGHSRGGEGVVRAYDRLVDEGYAVSNYGVDDIRVISSIAPTVFFNVEKSDPHEVAYHLLAGAADGDVNGAPSCGLCQFFRITGASDGIAQTTYVHGASHNDFNCCGFADGYGPDLIGRVEAQEIAKRYYLALLELYLDGNEAMRPFFERPADRFRPYGLDDADVIVNDYRDRLARRLVIDDFQSNPDPAFASSISKVTWTTDDLAEGQLRDGDGSLEDRATDRFNGMTQAYDSIDRVKGIVFEWSAPASVAWELDAGVADWSAYTTLSMRVAQQTRHPTTLGDKDFTVELEDADGTTSALRASTYAGVAPPYPRNGVSSPGDNGAGEGWSDEFTTLRIDPLDFLVDGRGVDLANVRFVRLKLGGEDGTATGRMALDDLEVLP